MQTLKYDAVVIGTGPAGQRAVIELSRHGVKTAAVEKQEAVGGVCLHSGTIPSKALRTAALVTTGWRYRNICCANRYPRARSVELPDLLRHVCRVTERELTVIKALLVRHGAEVHYGTARFVSPHRIRIAPSAQAPMLVTGYFRGTADGQNKNAAKALPRSAHPKRPFEIEAPHFFITTGTAARRPDGVPFNGRTVIDSDEIYTALTAIPNHMVIVGGGVIALEYAAIFSLLGVAVHVINRHTEVLPFVDAEIVDRQTTALRKRGVTIHGGRRVAHIDEVNGDCVQVHLDDNTCLETNLVMYAVGRVGTASELYPQAAGVAINERGLITVDEMFRSSASHIYAAGDIIGAPSLAASAREQGRLAARAMLNLTVKRTPPDEYPFGIYTIPEMAWVGKTERRLRAENRTYLVGHGEFSQIAKGEMLGDETGMLKLLVDPQSRQVLGAHAIGTDAAELIHVAHVLMQLGGTLEHLIAWVFNYPTLAESYKLAAYDIQSQLPSFRFDP